MLSRGQFEEQKRLLEITWNPQGLLWDMDLRQRCRPIAAQTYDPSHCFLCSGLLQKEMGMLLSRLKEHGITFDAVRMLMGANWKSCKCLGGGRAASNYLAVFSQARESHFKRTGEFSCGASEMLDIIAPFRYFLEVQNGDFQQQFANEIASFTALAETLGLISLGKDGWPVGDRVAQALHRHSQSFALAYGGDPAAYIPKFHFARHIPAQIARDGLVLDTLTCERYHQRTKNVADPIRNTRCFEYSVIGRSLQSHLSLLNAPFCFGTGLIKPQQFEDIGSDASIALSMVWEGLKLCEGDLLRLDGCPHVVHGCIEVAGEFALLTNALHNKQVVTPAASRWEIVDGLRVEPLANRAVPLCVAWSEEQNGRILIVDRA